MSWQGRRQRGVLVQKLVCHHQGGDCYPELTSREAGSKAVAFLEVPNIMQGKDDDRLADLGCLEQLLHELDECCGGIELQR